MIRNVLMIISVWFGLSSFSQQLQSEIIVELEVSLIETSGLIFLNDKIITHNDSGTAAELYEIDTLTGIISKTTVVKNAVNTDWEDICKDDNYIYIGDFGNNAGTRTDLKVLRVSITDYLTTLNDTVTADTISFNFGNQTTFTPEVYFTNFDVEALISFDDSLYIFTKNWGNSQTNYYALSKVPGSFTIYPKGNINSQGMITGATYNSLSDEVMLCGYTFFTPFIIRISQFLNDDFENGTIERFDLDVGSSSIQIEGVCAFSPEGYYFSSESYQGNNAELLRLDKSNDLSINSNANNKVSIFPNPANGELFINSDNKVYIEIYNLSNQLIFWTHQKLIDISQLSTGIYIVKIYSADGDIIKVSKITKE